MPKEEGMRIAVEEKLDMGSSQYKRGKGKKKERSERRVDPVVVHGPREGNSCLKLCRISYLRIHQHH